MDMREHVVALNTERKKDVEALKAHLEGWMADHPGEPMDADARATEDRIQAKITEREQEIKRFVDRETREQESAVIHEAFAGAFGEEAVQERGKNAAAEFIRWAKGDRTASNQVDPETGRAGFAVSFRNAERTIEAIRSGADSRDIRNNIWTTSAGSGSLLVPTDLESTIYQYMTASVAMMRMPTTKINSAAGNPLELPKVTTHGIATQVGEGTAIGGTDPVFGKAVLNSYKYGQLVYLSSETITDDGVDILGFVAGNVARAVGEKVATALVTGSGSGAPNGIETAVTNAFAPTGGTIHGLVAGVTFDNLIDLIYSVNDNYRARPSAAFLTRDLTAASLRKLRDGAGGTVGAYLWDASLTSGLQNGEPDRLLGYPVWTDPNVASVASTKKVVFFGDWNAYFVRTVGGFRFERSDEVAFASDEVAFRGLTRVDGEHLDANAINAVRVV
jgi:HK97 family phage major capsid protein